MVHIMDKKLPNLYTWLVPKLRQAARIWPGKNMAKDAAKEKVHIGFYKNGNPEYKIMYKCAECKELFDAKEIHIDHKIPVVGPEGFTNWDDYINRMFCDFNNLQTLCLICHGFKSDQENKERREFKKQKRKK